MKNAGWRNLRPVIDAASCTGCLQCYLHCPDGTVYKVPSACRPTEPADAAASPGTRSRDDAEGSRAEVSPEGTSCGARFASAIPAISGTGETLAGSLGEPACAFAPVAIDLDFCKGCGICAKACKFGSITMILESEANAR